MNFKKILKIPSLLILYIKMKIHGIKHGKNIRGKSVLFKNKGKIIIGNGVRLNSFPGGELYKTGLQAHCKDSVITIGDDSKLNGAMIHCRNSVTIGAHCGLGPGAVIVDNDSHRVSIHKEERLKPPKSLPITIKDHVWVGMNSLILKGVTIGENSIVAAKSVVTKDVPPNTIVAGNPAKIVKKLTK